MIDKYCHLQKITFGDRSSGQQTVVREEWTVVSGQWTERCDDNLISIFAFHCAADNSIKNRILRRMLQNIRFLLFISVFSKQRFRRTEQNYLPASFCSLSTVHCSLFFPEECFKISDFFCLFHFCSKQRFRRTEQNYLSASFCSLSTDNCSLFFPEECFFAFSFFLNGLVIQTPAASTPLVIAWLSGSPSSGSGSAVL